MRTPRGRVLLGGTLIGMVLALMAGYVVWRGAGGDAGARAGNLDLHRTGTLLHVKAGGGVVQSTMDGTWLGAGPHCVRAYAAGGTLACLRGLGRRFSAELEVYGSGGHSELTLPLWGIPSRVRVSASGNLVGWTVFREGDSYLANGAYSTTAGIYDLRSGAHYGSLEDFQPLLDGSPYRRQDVNYWGVTFAEDDRTFYATMSSAGSTWLMRGDLATRTLTALRRNVECPSLSPDGTRIAYKKRNGQRWRLHVLDLATGADTALAEPDHVDDQPAWLDPHTIAYTKPGPAVFAVPADGGGAPRRLTAGASPSPVR
ncbi:TolB family protein [Amycolatopsis cihanbeyliensis]|uniref:WD40 repeat protein n=1 Tax=Amycolatopsis cihanbeyliensis TaxID=1128664 RepID=A0A542DQG0_AMYCI|nr:hypothetical protein [Amycolatopsis cihanbeyliensis]TQJ05338.1 hypothetical protein FB471_5166 [Amycolatopsis cihanbeyliensis]